MVSSYNRRNKTSKRLKLHCGIFYFIFWVTGNLNMHRNEIWPEPLPSKRRVVSNFHVPQSIPSGHTCIHCGYSLTDWPVHNMMETNWELVKSYFFIVYHENRLILSATSVTPLGIPIYGRATGLPNLQINKSHCEMPISAKVGLVFSKKSASFCLVYKALMAPSR